MAQAFTKKDLQTGDIIETRNGERGVVILEKNCIVYQAGGFDELDVFTDDLFVDGPEREGDVFKVYREIVGPIGFNNRFGAAPVFRRRNDKTAKKRAAELSDKYEMKKGKARVIILEPCFRRCQKSYVDVTLKSDDADFALSEAPTLTVLGKIKIDRTFIPVPHAENLFFLYNKYQEERHLRLDREREGRGDLKENEPIIIIPEDNIRIHSRSMIVRMNEDGMLEDLREEDFDKAEKYLHRMQFKHKEG